MLGLLGGVAGLAARDGHEILAAVIAAGGAGLSIAAYVMFARQPGADRDGTTETAAIVVVALGVFAGAVSWLLAAGAGLLVVLALDEKQRQHGEVRLEQAELVGVRLSYGVIVLDDS